MGREDKSSSTDEIEAEREGAVDVLAQRLHWKFEIVDPGDELESWDQLDERQREIYRAGIRAILQLRDIIAVALS
jgi:hypothetical protein